MILPSMQQSLLHAKFPSLASLEGYTTRTRLGGQWPSVPGDFWRGGCQKRTLASNLKHLLFFSIMLLGPTKEYLLQLG